jgi:hypothetical protein
MSEIKRIAFDTSKIAEALSTLGYSSVTALQASLAEQTAPELVSMLTQAKDRLPKNSIEYSLLSGQIRYQLLLRERSHRGILHTIPNHL